METIFLSLRAQVAVGTLFMKSPVFSGKTVYLSNCLEFVRQTISGISAHFSERDR